jgi:hypothetical protein
VLAAILPILLAAGSDTPSPQVTLPSTDLISYLLNYGVLGIVAVLFVTRMIVPKKALDDVRQEAAATARAEEEASRQVLAQREQRITQLREQLARVDSDYRDVLRRYQEEMVPALVRATDLTKEATSLMRELITQRGRPPGA